MTDTPAEREAESTWTRLRRRRVAQWALAYAAGAWVLLQVLGFVSDAFAWPATAKQIATIVLAVGLPIVVVLGWYHGERGQRRVSGPELAVLTLLLLIGGGLLWLYSQRSVPTTTTATAETPAPVSAGVDGRPSIAVLPFDNRSRLEDDAFFVDGIHDDILTQLSKVSALRVISRTSVEQFRDTKLPMKAIATQLGVTKILEGGVQRAGDRVRINVQLIDAETDAHVWAENYDRELSAANIFAIQSELASAIADALKAALSPAERTRVAAVPTQNLEAWEAYQLGQQRFAKSTSDALDDAERFFQKAIALDPEFALAYVGLADTILLQIDYSNRPSQEGLGEAEQAARKALKLTPDLAEAWAFLGAIAVEPEEAVRRLRRAIELSPSLAVAHLRLSNALDELGERDEALQHAERALQLDPLSAGINIDVGYTFDEMGRFDEAAARYRRAIEIDPQSSIAYMHLAFLHAYAWNRFAEAVPLIERAIELDTGNSSIAGVLAFVLLDMDEETRSARAMADAMRNAPDGLLPNVYAAWYYSTLGDHAAAESSARKVVEVSPRESWSLSLLRNADLREGDLRAARARYASAFPEFLTLPKPRVDIGNVFAAIDFAYLLQQTGERELSLVLLDGSEQAIRKMPRMGSYGFAYADIQIHAIRGDKSAAIAALREAAQAGWRSWWRYFRDFDPALQSIRNEPEFKAIFGDIERDMARQRAALAARPKDAPLDLGAAGT